MATVIDTGPSGWDVAAQAFQQAFQNGQQLAVKRRELDLEAQRVQSATDMDAVQRRKLEGDIEQQNIAHTAADAANKVHAAMAAHPDILSDPGKATEFAAQQLANIPGGMQAWGGLYSSYQQATSSRASALFQASETARMDASRLRQERVDAGIHNVMDSWKTRLNTPEGVSGMLRDAAAISTDEAAKLAQTFASRLEGNWTPVVGQNGDVILVEHNSGSVHQTGINLGARGAGAGNQVSKEESLFALQNLASSIDQMQKLVAGDDDADINPAVSAIIGGIHLGSGGVGTGPGAGKPLSNMLKSDTQQQFDAASQVFVHSLASVMPRGQRSMPLILSLMSGYIPQSGFGKTARYALRQKRLIFKRRVLQLLNNLQHGQPADLSLLPGYSQDALEAANEQQQGGGAPVPGGNVQDFLQPQPLTTQTEVPQ